MRHINWFSTCSYHPAMILNHSKIWFLWSLVKRENKFKRLFNFAVSLFQYIDFWFASFGVYEHMFYFFIVILNFLREGNIFPGRVFYWALNCTTSLWICNHFFIWATWKTVNAGTIICNIPKEAKLHSWGCPVSNVPSLVNKTKQQRNCLEAGALKFSNSWVSILKVCFMLIERQGWQHIRVVSSVPRLRFKGCVLPVWL